MPVDAGVASPSSFEQQRIHASWHHTRGSKESDASWPIERERGEEPMNGQDDATSEAPGALRFLAWVLLFVLGTGGLVQVLVGMLLHREV